MVTLTVIGLLLSLAQVVITLRRSRQANQTAVAWSHGCLYH